MTIKTRACKNCAAFNPADSQNEPSCWNLVSFTDRAGQHRAPGAQDVCDAHQSHNDGAIREPGAIDAKGRAQFAN